MAASPGAAPRTSVGLVVLALFLAPIVNGFYAGAGLETPGFIPHLIAGALSLSICAWFADYSRRHRIAWVMDMGWFVFTAWIVVVPYYVLKAEGRSGLARLALFCFTYFAAWMAGWAVQIWARLVIGIE